jgi:hypothetical protein
MRMPLLRADNRFHAGGTSKCLIYGKASEGCGASGNADRDFTIRMPGGIAQSCIGGLVYERQAAIEDEGDAVRTGCGGCDVCRLRHR